MIVIAGPCVIDERTLDIAETMAQMVASFAPHIEFYFKSSFDKANRTCAGSYRGPGLEKGLAILREVQRRHGFRLTTDVHEVHQVGLVADVVDVIQIPALLSRQTDLIRAAGASGRAVSIKKGQFAAPEDLRYAVEKAKGAGCQTVWLIERGVTFGYHRLVVDMLSFPALRATGAEKTICDCTHSLQLPAAGGGCSAAMARDYAPILARAATAAGADGVFAEVYPDPDQAKCDGPNSLSFQQWAEMIGQCLPINRLVQRRPNH